MTGTSPAPARVAGNFTSILSKPRIPVGPTKVTLSPVISVVPILTVTEVLAAKRTPVRLISSTVGTVAPVESTEVTLKGSPKQPSVRELVILQTIARPNGPLVVVKIS